MSICNTSFNQTLMFIIQLIFIILGKLKLLNILLLFGSNRREISQSRSDSRFLIIQITIIRKPYIRFHID